MAFKVQLMKDVSLHTISPAEKCDAVSTPAMLPIPFSKKPAIERVEDLSHPKAGTRTESAALVKFAHRGIEKAEEAYADKPAQIPLSLANAIKKLREGIAKTELRIFLSKEEQSRNIKIHAKLKDLLNIINKHYKLFNRNELSDLTSYRQIKFPVFEDMVGGAEHVIELVKAQYRRNRKQIPNEVSQAMDALEKSLERPTTTEIIRKAQEVYAAAYAIPGANGSAAAGISSNNEECF